MSLAFTEYLRSQIETPLWKRHIWFVFFSIFLLLPLSILWSFFAGVRARRRRKAQPPAANEPWILSVGNVAVGGTGKSPVVRFLSSCALEEGFDIAILTRGVGKETNSESIVLSLHSSNHTLPFEFFSQLSDETLEHALLLHPVLPHGACVWLGQGRDRRALLNEIREKRAKECAQRGQEPTRPLMVLLDDGLQQTSLSVHRDVVVWDPESVIHAPRFCLPFGPYRMGSPFARPWAASLPQADLVIWSRLRSASMRNSFLEAIERARMRLFHPHHNTLEWTEISEAQDQVCAVERARLVRVVPETGSSGFKLADVTASEFPLEVKLLCGIARPERFVKTFQGMYPTEALPSVTEVAFLADHAAWDENVLSRMDGPSVIVTTLKDVCRWWDQSGFRTIAEEKRLFAVCVDISVESLDPKLNVKSLLQLCRLGGVAE